MVEVSIKIKRIGKGAYNITQPNGTIIEATKSYDNKETRSYDWVISLNGEIVDSCITLTEAKSMAANNRYGH